MSLDISLTEVRLTCIFDANYTHNVTPMWHLAGCYEALYESHGKQAREVLPAIHDALHRMRGNPAAYIKLNPKNGWGSYDTAVEWLAKLYVEFCKHPDATIGVSR